LARSHGGVARSHGGVARSRVGPAANEGMAARVLDSVASMAITFAVRPSAAIGDAA